MWRAAGSRPGQVVEELPHVDFEVLEPPELVDALRAVADRLSRAAAGGAAT